MKEDLTLKYYNDNSEGYVKSTIDVDMKETYEMFLSNVAYGAHILDLGCGSGRDSKYFLSKGFQVTAVDGSKELCKLASDLIGINVRELLFQNLDYAIVFDAVWANASLLHLKREELIPVLEKIRDALKPGGILFASFKYGSFSGYRDGRYYTDYDEKSIEDIINEIEGLSIMQTVITHDKMQGRENLKWLNVLCRKK